MNVYYLRDGTEEMVWSKPKKYIENSNCWNCKPRRAVINQVEFFVFGSIDWIVKLFNLNTATSRLISENLRLHVMFTTLRAVVFRCTTINKAKKKVPSKMSLVINSPYSLFSFTTFDAFIGDANDLTIYFLTFWQGSQKYLHEPIYRVH